MGYVADIFTKEVLGNLPGNAAIGHVRYSTTGESTIVNAQPFVVDCVRGAIAIAHNGNLVGIEQTRSELESKGAIFQSTMDTEVIVHLMARSKKEGIVSALVDALAHVTGAYALLILTPKEMIAVRDPYGFRPLVIGRLGESWVVASETCAFDLIGATFYKEVEPGEVVVFSERGMEIIKAFAPLRESLCVFELIYFARPDSLVFGQNVYEIRKSFGKVLGKESRVDADLVIPVPDSGIPAAIGFAEQTDIEFDLGLIRNHYVGRTFIEPEQSIRHFGVKLKLNTLRDFLKNKRVVVVDDSIVRGTTSRKIVEMLRNAGAKEVHFRISSPPVTHPCFYGIDMPTKEELIASKFKDDIANSVADYIKADSLSYLSLEGLYSVVGSKKRFCYACFTGDYPIKPNEIRKWKQLKIKGLGKSFK